MAKYERLECTTTNARTFLLTLNMYPQLYFMANNVTEEKQVAGFLSMIVATTFGLLCNLVARANPKDKEPQGGFLN